jgi:hypothetical protein
MKYALLHWVCVGKIEIMNTEIESRLAALRNEYEKGRERLRELQLQQSQVEETLLRIEGAMTVLQEFLPSDGGQASASSVRPSPISAQANPEAD